jgi:hypothetical protein
MRGRFSSHEREVPFLAPFLGDRGRDPGDFGDWGGVAKAAIAQLPTFVEQRRRSVS